MPGSLPDHGADVKKSSRRHPHRCVRHGSPWNTAWDRDLASGGLCIPHPSSTFSQLDFRGAIHLGFLEILFAFLFVDLFDNVGTLVGV